MKHVHAYKHIAERKLGSDGWKGKARISNCLRERERERGSVSEQMRAQKLMWTFQRIRIRKREKGSGKRGESRWKTIQFTAQYGGTFDCTSQTLRERGK